MPAQPFQQQSLAWQRSTRCNGGQCIEVAKTPHGGRAMRDNKLTNGPILIFTKAEWAIFVSEIKSDAYDVQNLN
jgi:hypothetical protein